MMAIMSDFLKTGHTLDDSKVIMKVWYAAALILEAAGIITFIIGWRKDVWFFAASAIFLFLTSIIHIMIQLLSIDIHIAELIEQKRAKNE